MMSFVKVLYSISAYIYKKNSTKLETTFNTEVVRILQVSLSIMCRVFGALFSHGQFQVFNSIVPVLIRKTSAEGRSVL
jgi:hypothetical protein